MTDTTTMTTNDAMFADRAVRETCNVVSTDDSRPALGVIHLSPLGTDQTHIVGTDSYRAVTAVVNAQPFDETRTHDPANGATWADVVSNATPISEAYPNMERIFESAREGRGVTRGERVGYSGHMRRDAVSDLKDWSYFDGERRKPYGIVELTVEDSTLCVTFGMQVKDKEKRRVPTVTMWEKGPREVFKLTGDDVDITHTIGVFHAAYLPDFHTVTEIRYGDSALKPLYLASGKVEYVVMPIRMPEE